MYSCTIAAELLRGVQAHAGRSPLPGRRQACGANGAHVAAAANKLLCRLLLTAGPPASREFGMGVGASVPAADSVVELRKNGSTLSTLYQVKVLDGTQQFR